jgi:hypothetical protein
MRFGLATVALIATTIATPGFAATLDFEGYPDGSTTLTGNEFASLGVLFGSEGGTGAQIYNYGSGSLTSTITSDDWYRPLWITFVNPANSSENWTVDSISILNRLAEDEWTVSAYDLAGNTLGTQTISYTEGTVSFSGIGRIHSVRLDASITAFAADNVSFAGLSAPVPEPETYAMFLAGLGLMGAIARRKKLAA